MVLLFRIVVVAESMEDIGGAGGGESGLTDIGESRSLWVSLCSGEMVASLVVSPRSSVSCFMILFLDLDCCF